MAVVSTQLRAEVFDFLEDFGRGVGQGWSGLAEDRMRAEKYRESTPWSRRGTDLSG